MAAAAPVLQYTPWLGDQRSFRRLCGVVQAWVQRAEASLPQLLAAPAAVKATYRFFANRAVSPAAILATARPDCLTKLASEPRMLLLQDTTVLDFSHHPATAGLGPTGTSKQHTRGFFVHSCLAATTSGVPRSVVAQQLWARDPAAAGSGQQRRQRAWAEKESQRWWTVEQASQLGLPATVETVTVADAEADIFALFAAPRPPQAQLLIRVAQPQRKLEDGQALGVAAAAAPVWGHYTLRLPARATRPARTAVCTLRVSRVPLRPPVPLTALWVEEDQPPPGTAPLQRLLLTTLPVTTFFEAVVCVGYYAYRWLIEQYHFVLKTGCGVERLQLQTEDRLERAVATACLVAIRLLWLTCLEREQPAAPCTVVFEPAEWQALCCARSQTPVPPAPPPTLQEAVRMVALLGGFLGRKGDGEPGPRTIWRGLTRLADLAAMWRLLHPPPSVRESG